MKPLQRWGLMDSVIKLKTLFKLKRAHESCSHTLCDGFWYIRRNVKTNDRSLALAASVLSCQFKWSVIDGMNNRLPEIEFWDGLLDINRNRHRSSSFTQYSFYWLPVWWEAPLTWIFYILYVHVLVHVFYRQTIHFSLEICLKLFLQR